MRADWYCKIDALSSALVLNVRHLSALYGMAPQFRKVDSGGYLQYGLQPMPEWESETFYLYHIFSHKAAKVPWNMAPSRNFGGFQQMG